MITEAEQKYIRLCEEVNTRALRVVGAASNEHAERAAALALALCDFVCDEKQAILMRQEQADGYDLAALKVDTATASHSETCFEDRG